MFQDEYVRPRRYGKLGNSLALDGVGSHGTGAHGNWGMGNTALEDWSTIRDSDLLITTISHS